MARDLVTKLTVDSRQFVREMNRAESAAGRFGTKTTTSARKGATETERANKRIGASFSQAAKRAAAGAAIFGGAYAAIGKAKKAVSTTEELAKTTVKLQRNLGLTTKAASEYAAVAQSRGIQSKPLIQTFTILSKQTEAAAGGTKKSIDAFKALGITQDDLKRGQQDFSFLLGKVSDGLAGMEGGTKRSAIAAQLLGRGYQTLLPLLGKGNVEVQKQLDLANKYGATLDGKTLKSVNDLIQAQREMKLANIGLQISFTRNVAPSLLQAERAFGRFAQQINQGKTDQAFSELFDRIGKLTEKAAPVLAKNAGKLGVAIAKGLVTGFLQADPLSKAVILGLVAKRLGLFALAGRRAGAAFSGGMATTSGGGIIGGAARGGAVSTAGGVAAGTAGGVAIGRTARVATAAGRLAGPAALAVTLIAGPDLIKAIGRPSDPERSRPGLPPTSQSALSRVIRGTPQFREAEQAARRGDFSKLAKQIDMARDSIRRWPKDAAPSVSLLRRFQADVQRIKLGNTVRELKSFGIAARGVFNRQRAENVLSSFRYLESGAVRSLKGVSNSVRLNMKEIRTTFARDPKAMANALQANFNAASVAIAKAMARGEINAKTGLRKILSYARKDTGATRDTVAKNFSAIAQAIGTYMDKSGDKTGRGFRLMLSAIRRNTGGSRDTVQKNFRAIADVIAAQTEKGRISTRDAMALINRYVDTQLNRFGITNKPATGGTGQPGQKGGRAKNARGGWARPRREAGGWIGERGMAEPDNQVIMVGGGEAVVNRHQQPYVEQAMRFAKQAGVVPYGNLDELYQNETRPHYAFAKGGRVSGGIQQVDQTASKRILGGQSRFWSGLSTGSDRIQFVRMAGGQPARVPVKNNIAVWPSGNLMRGLAAMTGAGDTMINALTGGQHSATSNHYRGLAVDLDLTSGLGVGRINAIAGRFGGRRKTSPPSELTHIHLDFPGGAGSGPIGGGGGGAGIAGGVGVEFEGIKRVKVRDDLGTISKVAQAGADKTRTAANKWLRRQYDKANAGGGGTVGVGATSNTMMGIARIILNVGKRFGADPKRMLAAIEAGLVESNLQNLSYGDLDSLGVFQQRSSWGSAAQRQNVTYAASKFFETARGATGGTAGQLAQAVQRSGFPGRYDQRRGQAISILRRLGYKASFAGFAKGGWVRTGATIDPTKGQDPPYSSHGGMSFAELLVAGANRGRGRTLTSLLGLKAAYPNPTSRDKSYGMPMGTAVWARMPGRKQAYKMWKNDVGSGQSSTRYTTDLHQRIANKLGWKPNQDIEVSATGTGAATDAAGHGGTKADTSGKPAALTGLDLKAQRQPLVEGAFSLGYETGTTGRRLGSPQLQALYEALYPEVAEATGTGSDKGKPRRPRSAAATGIAAYTFPLPTFASQGRTDRGQDMEARRGYATTVALGAGKILGTNIGFPGPQLLLSDGPLKGATVFYGHNSKNKVRGGQTVKRGQAVGATGGPPGGSPTHTEIGFFKLKGGKDSGYFSQSGSWSGPGSAGGRQMNRLLAKMKPNWIKVRAMARGGRVGRARMPMRRFAAGGHNAPPKTTKTVKSVPAWGGKGLETAGNFDRYITKYLEASTADMAERLARVQSYLAGVSARAVEQRFRQVQDYIDRIVDKEIKGGPGLARYQALLSPLSKGWGRSGPMPIGSGIQYTAGKLGRVTDPESQFVGLQSAGKLDRYLERFEGEKDDTKAKNLLAKIQGYLGSIDDVSLKAIDQRFVRFRKQIRRLQKDGVTPEEAKQIKQLQGLMTLFSEEAGRRVGLMVKGASERLTAATEGQDTALSRQLRRQGIDDSSSQALRAQIYAGRDDASALTGQIYTLAAARKEAERYGDTALADDLKNQIAEAADKRDEANVVQIERGRQLMAAVAGESAQRVQDMVENIDLSQRAGLITEKDATKGTRAIREQALLGRFGPLARKDALEILAALRDNTAATESNNDALNAVRDEISKANASSAAMSGTELQAITKVLADMMNGQIVGRGLVPRSRTGGAGRVTTY